MQTYNAKYFSSILNINILLKAQTVNWKKLHSLKNILIALSIIHVSDEYRFMQ